MFYGSLLRLIAIACLMIIGHESAHVLVTRRFGGHFGGLRWARGAVGVHVTVDGLSSRAIALTLITGPLADGCIVVLATLLWPAQIDWWLLLGSVQWLSNLVPWGFFPNDGTRLWRLWRTRSAS